MAENAIRIVVTASGAAEAQKVLAAVASAGGQIGSIGAPAIKRAEDALNSFGASAKRVFEIFTGVSLVKAVGMLKSLGDQAYNSGLQALQAERAFRGMTEAVGVNADALLARMQAVSKGLADQSDLMLASARGLQQGLSENQLVKVLELATGKAKLAGKSVAEAYGAISDAISENSVRSLKQFGIVLDLDDVMKKYAATLGTFPEALSAAEKTQAIFNATMEAAAKQTRAATTALDENVDRLERNKVRIKGFWEDVGVVIVNAHGDLLAFWQDFNKAAEDFGRRKMAELGVGLAPGPSEGLPGGIGTSDIGRGGRSAPVPIPPEVIAAPDLLKRALAEADHALKMLNATMAAGLSTSADYAAGLQAAISKLQALGSSLDEDGRLKLLAFQAALAAINFAKFQQDLATSLQATQAWGLGLINSVKESVAQRNSTMEQGAVAEANIRVAMLAADRVRLAQSLADFKGNEAQKFQLEQQYAALAIKLAEAKSAARIAVWAKETAALRDFIDKLNSDIDAALRGVTQGVDEHARANREAAEAQKKWTDAMDVMMTGLDGAADEFDRTAAATKRAGRALTESLAGIDRQAALLGPSFDALGAKADLFQRRILELQAIKNPTGEILTEIDQLKAKFADTRELIQWRDAFKDVFSSIGSAISTSIQGVILGTQTMAQAWDKLWKSILLSFVNSGVQRMLKGLQDWALDFFFGKSGGGGGGGGAGGLIGGRGGGGGGGGGRSRGGGGSPFVDPTGQELPGELGFNMAATTEAVGGFTQALQFATSGTSAFTSSLLNVQAIGAGLWGAAGGAGGALGPAFTGVGAVDVAIAGGSLTDIGAAASAAIGPITSMNVAFAGVAAAMAVFGTVMDFVNGKTEAAIGGLVGGVAGAVGGGVLGSIFLGPGLGTIFGALAGGAIGDFLGSLIGGLFGGPSNYELKRLKAADEASAFVGGTGQGYQAALESGSLDKILGALQSLGTGVNPLRTELVLTSTLAEQLGLTGEREGDNVIVQWAQVTEAQLGELIALFKASPEMAADVIRGGGDIAYLTPDKVKPYVEALEQGAEAMLTAFAALGAVADKINEVANDLTEAAKEALPPGLAQEFADGIVNPIRDRMLAVINSGLPAAEMQKQLDAINRELQGKVEAWNMFAVAIKQATVIDALIPANLHEQFRAVMEPAYAAMLQAMRTGTAEQAKLQAEHFATLTQAWAAFSDVAQAKMNVEELLAPLGDLGERFDAAMQPVYDKILASLVAGNGKIALAQTQTFARLTQAWAALGKATEQRLDVAAVLPTDLADRFRVQMQPQFDAILAALVAGHAEVAAGLIDRVTKQMAVWVALGQATTQAIDVEALLPDDLPAQFHARMAPQWTAILAALAAGHTELAARMVDTFNKQLAAWASIGQTVTRITGELAGLTGNLEGTAESWIAVQRQMDGAVTRAQAAFDKALASGDVEQIARTAALLHDATMTRLEAELAMVKQIEDAIAATLQSASGLVKLVTTIALLEIEMSGSIGTVQALLGALEGMATSGATATQRMWAVQEAIQAIIAVLPGLIERFASFSTAAEWLAKGMQTAEELRAGPAGPGAITGAVITGAAPFLAAQQAEIDAATGPARLALLQQQAATLQSLAAAAIAGVKQWAQAAIAGARAAADEVIKGARTEADRRIDVARTEAARRQALIDAAREKALAAIDAEIEAAETAARLGQEARRAQIEALQDLIAKSKEWEAAVESMGKFIQSLKVGPLGPGNPADKLAQAQDAFAKALQAYNAAPTAGGLTDLQGLAQTMLGLAEPIFSKPSPQFQALSANTIKQLEAAQAVAEAQMTDSAVLQAQLDMLIAMDKAATLASAALLDGLRVQREAITKDFEKQTKDLSDALDKYIGEVEVALKKYIGDVELALDKQILAIEKAAKDEIDAINIGLIGALKANAIEQAGLLGEEAKKIDKLIEALTSTEYEGVKLGDIAVYAAKRQDVAIGILEAIKNGIGEAVGHPLARGSERVTEGLYHLHDDEAVLPKALAERFRAAGGFDQMIRSAAEGAGITDPYGDLQYDPTGRYKPSLGNLAPKFVFTGPQAEALNQLQGIIEMLEGRLQADITGNTYKKFGKVYTKRTAAELEALKVRVGEQVAELHRQQQALIDSIPPPTVTPTKGKPPTGTPPVYIPPGPAWLTRGGDVNPNAASGSAPVGGSTTIIVKLDSKTIGEATLPTIHFDARGGKLRTIFLETRPK